MKSNIITGPHIQNGLLCWNCNGNGHEADLEVCKVCRGAGLEKQRIISMGLMRDLEAQVAREEITYSRMVEIINQTATKFMYDWIREQVNKKLEYEKREFNCPSCGRKWDTEKNSVCECGAEVKRK